VDELSLGATSGRVPARARPRWALPGLALVACALSTTACDAPASSAGAATGSAAATVSAPEGTSSALADKRPEKKKRPMPPRPVPLGSAGPIQPSAPPDQQVMAIQYTLAMVAPDPLDPLVDKEWMAAALKKLGPAVRAVDKGKARPEPARADKGQRKLVLELGRGCTESTPAAVLRGQGVHLSQAYEAGVLVVACHDDKWECHQSTRDPEDVLCHAAPR
jgi:hypothetical protein